ncbi:hypothetical protein B0H10DRAFT_2247224 [Mycena sp. CBHHK59/15]|nr:hypothetical protein B0H10DRAFT_2247224 [Mycena sp. CBHHK59/15]
MPSIATASLAETCLEIFLYGVYTVLFTTVIYLFRSRRRILPEKRPALWVFLGLVVQFLTITAHWIDTIYETFFTFVRFGGGAAAEAFYLDLTTPSSVSVLAILVESAALQTYGNRDRDSRDVPVGFVGQVVWTGIAPAVLGISTVLIHARIGLGWAHESDRQAKSNPTTVNFAANSAFEEEHELEDRPHK